MTDQTNENPAVGSDDVEGHALPKWHAIEDEPAAESKDDVEGHALPKWHAIEDEPAAESKDDDVEGHRGHVL